MSSILPREISDTFKSNPKLIHKMASVFAVQNLIVIANLLTVRGNSVWANNRLELVLLSLLLSPVGAFFVFIFPLAQTLNRLIAAGERVNPILRFYFGNSGYSVFAWLPTLLFVGFVIAMITLAIPN